MKILAFDTSTKFLSIALLEGNEAISEFHEDVGIRHSEILVPTIETLLKGSGWSVCDIDLVCMGIGPGSFTGLRIAAATVKGLAAVSCEQVAGVPTMDVMVRNFLPMDGRVAPLMDARKGKVYSCIYNCSGDNVEKLTEYMLVSVDELLNSLDEKTTFFGDAVGIYKDQLVSHPLAGYISAVDWYPKACWVGRLGVENAKGITQSPAELEPLYLHSKECNITSRGEK